MRSCYNIMISGDFLSFAGIFRAPAGRLSQAAGHGGPKALWRRRRGRAPQACCGATQAALWVSRERGRLRPSIGASPSGKAADFDSAMRRFESSRPSQAFRHGGDFLLFSSKGRESNGLRSLKESLRPLRRAFRDIAIGDRGDVARARARMTRRQAAATRRPLAGRHSRPTR